jgi:hypothetical protein
MSHVDPPRGVANRKISGKGPWRCTLPADRAANLMNVGILKRRILMGLAEKISSGAA